MALKVTRAANTLIKHIKELNTSGLNIAEIGLHQAKTAKKILTECNHLIAEYYGIDPYTVFEGSCNHTTAHGDNMYMNVLKSMNMFGQFSVIREKSTDAVRLFPDKYFDFIYIDANHSYEYVSEDIRIWMPKLKPNSLLAGHDYSRKHPGVVRAVHEFFGKSCERDKGTLFIVRFKNGIRIV